MIALAVAVGAALGAPARYLVDRVVQSRHDTPFPWGTLTVNLVASLVLGVLTGAAGQLSATTAAVLGTGFCGALSTYSTFGFEAMRLSHQRARFHATAYVVLSVLAGLGVAALGWSIGAAIG